MYGVFFKIRAERGFFLKKWIFLAFVKYVWNFDDQSYSFLWKTGYRQNIFLYRIFARKIQPQFWYIIDSAVKKLSGNCFQGQSALFWSAAATMQQCYVRAKLAIRGLFSLMYKTPLNCGLTLLCQIFFLRGFVHLKSITFKSTYTRPGLAHERIAGLKIAPWLWLNSS